MMTRSNTWLGGHHQQHKSNGGTSLRNFFTSPRSSSSSSSTSGNSKTTRFNETNRTINRTSATLDRSVGLLDLSSVVKSHATKKVCFRNDQVYHSPFPTRRNYDHAYGKEMESIEEESSPKNRARCERPKSNESDYGRNLAKISDDYKSERKKYVFDEDEIEEVAQLSETLRRKRFDDNDDDDDGDEEIRMFFDRSLRDADDEEDNAESSSSLKSSEFSVWSPPQTSSNNNGGSGNSKILKSPLRTVVKLAKVR